MVGALTDSENDPTLLTGTAPHPGLSKSQLTSV